MVPGRASPPEASEGRPAFTCAYKRIDHPVPASAVRHWAPDPVVRSGRPESTTVYIELTPEMTLEANRTGYAFITPDPAEIADPKAFIRSAIHAAAPGLQFELLATTPMVAEMCLLFATAEDRAAAIAKQPFELDGFTVEVVREGEQRNWYPAPMLDYLAHINLLNYPKEERTKNGIGSNLGGIGHVVEIDPACFDAPDLSPVGVVIQLQDPRDIPREFQIRYVGWYGSASVCPREVARNIIPIEVVEVWDQSLSIDAHGRYMPLFEPGRGSGGALAASCS